MDERTDGVRLALARREAAVLAEEQAADERLQVHAQRRRILVELREDVREREIRLRARALRLGQDARELLADMPSLSDDPGMLVEEVAHHDEAAAILEARAELLTRRETAVTAWKAHLDRALAGELGAEERLLAREQTLADAFRRLILLASDPARPSIVGTATSPGRRKHQRIEVRVPVTYSGPHEFIAGSPGEARNVSAGGLFVATADVLSPGRAITLRLELPDESDVTVSGVVAWGRTSNTHEGPPGFGVRFGELDAPAERAIGRFLSYRAPIPDVQRG